MPKSKPEPWAINIVGYELVPPDQLLAHPDNPKIHPGEQRDVMRGMLDEIGFIAPMIVNRRTEHVLDGHMRIEEAITRGQPTVPVMFVDVPEEREPEVLALFDPIRGLAKTDDAKLQLLLGQSNAQNAHLVAFLAQMKTLTPKLLGEDTADLTPPADPITQPGDLWILGGHTVCPKCGHHNEVGL